jgi:hypothetical protein
MDGEIKELLGEEIKAQLADVSLLQTGSAEKTAAVSDLAALYRLKLDEDKNELEDGKRKDEGNLEGGKLSEAARDRYFRLGIAAAEIVLPLIFYACWMRRGFRFEETGAFTSTTFRGLFSRFKPTKR